jgi:tellurite resistance protein TerC
MRIMLKKAILWTCFWVFAALVFNVYVYFLKGPEAALQFFTGYLVEKSLSIDNLFVFALIFSTFQVTPAEQQRILRLGVITALVLRLLLILLGAALIARFHWVTYLFGAFLLLTGGKFFFQKGKKFRPEENRLVKGIQRLFPRFRKGTPLVLLLVECTDLVFALDSIPAIFAITTDLFIVYTSNVFAILGLRSLYFVLAAFLPKFRHLPKGLAVILVFVGLKMLIAPLYVIPVGASLAVIVAILLISILRK